MSLVHDELAEDLARVLGMPFLNVSLGSVYLAGRGKGPSRADVISVKPSYNRFAISIYEIKVSRSDFLSEIRSEKWKGYLPHCHRFYFAMPQGIARKDEIPYPAGLYVKGPKGWSVVKAAKKLDSDIPIETMKALIFAKTRLPARMKRRNEINRNLELNKYSSDRERRKLFGKTINDALRKYDEYESKIAELDWQLEQVEEIVKALSDLTGSVLKR